MAASLQFVLLRAMDQLRRRQGMSRECVFCLRLEADTNARPECFQLGLYQVF